MRYIINAKLTQIPSYFIVGFFAKWAFLGCSTWLRKISCPRVVFHLAEAAGTKGCVLWRYWDATENICRLRAPLRLPWGIACQTSLKSGVLAQKN
jgi:hypothetical protein